MRLFWIALLLIININYGVQIYLWTRQYARLKDPNMPIAYAPYFTQDEYTSSRLAAQKSLTVELMAMILSFIQYNLVIGTNLAAFCWKKVEGHLKTKWGIAEDRQTIHTLIHASIVFVAMNIIDAVRALILVVFYQTSHKIPLSLWNLISTRAIAMMGKAGRTVILAAWSVYVYQKKGRSGFLIVLLSEVLLFLVMGIGYGPFMIRMLATALPDGPLRTRIEALANRVGYPTNRIYYSTENIGNAFFTGFYWSRHILLYEGLIKLMTTEEILAVVAHELGHWHNDHILQTANLHGVFIIVTAILTPLLMNYGRFYRDFNMTKSKPIYVCMFLVAILALNIGFIVEPLKAWHSRRAEYQADQFSVGLGYGSHLGSALLRLEKSGNAFPNHDRLYNNYSATHPDFQSRQDAINGKNVPHFGIFATIERWLMSLIVLVFIGTFLFLVVRLLWRYFSKQKVLQAKRSGAILSTPSTGYTFWQQQPISRGNV